MLPGISDVSDRPGLLNYRVRVHDKDKGRELALADDETTVDYHKCKWRKTTLESRATEEDVVGEKLLVVGIYKGAFT